MAIWDRDSDESEWSKYQKECGAEDRFSALEQLRSRAKKDTDEDEDAPQKSGILDRVRETLRKTGSAAPDVQPEPCPWCGRETQLGYLRGGRDSAFWSTETPRLFNALSSRVDILNEGRMLTGFYKTCWFCQDCRKIFFDTGRLPEPLGDAPSFRSTYQAENGTGEDTNT